MHWGCLAKKWRRLGSGVYEEGDHASNLCGWALTHMSSHCYCDSCQFHLINLQIQEIKYTQATAAYIKEFFDRHPGAGEAPWVFYGMIWGPLDVKKANTRYLYTYYIAPMLWCRLCQCPAAWHQLLALQNPVSALQIGLWRLRTGIAL